MFNHRGRIVADGLGVLFTTILQDPLFPSKRRKGDGEKQVFCNGVENRYMLPDKEESRAPSLLTRPSWETSQRVGALLAFEKA
jgi:hypothetical protein